MKVHLLPLSQFGCPHAFAATLFSVLVGCGGGTSPESRSRDASQNEPSLADAAAANDASAASAPEPWVPTPDGTCGDGTCGPRETCSTCAEDCGACAGVCGDGVCGDNETCSTCEADCNACPQAKPEAPNFVLVVIDDMGWYGSPVRTDPSQPSSLPYMRMPNLANIASRGVTFSRAYAAAPMCVPSRVSIHTGMSPARSGMTIGESGTSVYPESDGPRNEPDMRRYNQYMPMFSSFSDINLDRKEKTIAEVLAPLGYDSAALGKWHMEGGTPSDHGYSVHSGTTTNNEGNQQADTDQGDPKRTLSTTRAACDFVKQKAKKGEKFFANVNYYAVHAKARSLETTLRRYTRVLPGDSPQERRTAAWMAMAEELDRGIGILRACLQEAGVADNTYLFVISDNGYDHDDECSVALGRPCPLFGHKWTLWDRGLRIPFWVEGPGVVSGSGATRFIPSYVNHIDLLPTMYELAGGTKLATDAPQAEGLSLVPLLKNAGGVQQFAQRPMFFHWPHYRGGGTPSSVIIQGGWKLTRFYEFPGLRALIDLNNDPRELVSKAQAEAERFNSMNALLTDYLESSQARMPTVNPGWCEKQPGSLKCRDPEYDWRDWDVHRPCRYLQNCTPTL